jgi:glucose/arabinose dehydrogenase
VRKRVEFLSFIAIVAVVFAVISCGSALQAQSDTPQSSSPQSQQQPQQPPDTQAPTPQQPQSQQTPSQQPSQGQASQDPSGKSQTSDPGGSSEFIGTVVKQGDKYMFQDAASGQTYDIDHQDEVKKFEGKKVRVHGTLDPSTKTIHVQ